MSLDGQKVVVIRVEPSTQAPHIFKATGAIYVRERGGRKPISSQSTLLELCMRPQEAEQRAIARMTRLPLVAQAIAERPLGQPAGQTRVSDWSLAASPLSVPKDFRRHALALDTVNEMERAVREAAAQLGPPAHAAARLRPEPIGAFAYGQNAASGDEATLLLDAGGVAVSHLRRRLTQDAWHVGATATRIIAPLLTLATGVLTRCGATGKALVHLYLRIAPTARGFQPTLDLYTAHSRGQLRAPPDQPAFFGGHIELPTEPAAEHALAEQMMHEIARASGIGWWE